MTSHDVLPPIAGHYRFSPSDYLALVAAMRRPQWRRYMAVSVIWVGVFVMLMALISESGAQFQQAVADLVSLRNVPVYVYFMLASVPVFLALIPLVRLLQARRSYRWSAIAEREIDLSFDAEAVLVTSPGRCARLEWSVVRSVVEREDHAFLVLGRSEAIVIPKRAFISEALFRAAIDLARSNMLLAPAPAN